MEMDMTEQTELQAIKEIATNMGLKVGNMKDVDKIKALIEEAKKPAEPAKALSRTEARAQLKAEKMKLVRIKITPMAPFERQLKGITIKVGNSLLGDVQRFVPYNREWHVEQCIYENLVSRKYRQRVEKTDPDTKRKYYENEFLPALGVVKLDPLTDAEIKALAADQKARSAID
jgi:hypothetical protein